MKRQQWADEDRFILYVFSPRDAETLGRLLEGKGYRTSVLVGTDPPDAKDRALRQWLGQGGQWLVSTNAGGAGIDCSHIRAVVQASPAAGLIDCAQKEGRCGRDGRPAIALTLVSNSSPLWLDNAYDTLIEGGAQGCDTELDRELRREGLLELRRYLKREGCMRMIRQQYLTGSAGLGCLGSSEVNFPCSHCKLVIEKHNVKVRLPEWVSRSH